MQGILYEESSLWLFLFVTGVLGGGAAWMAGRAVALGWQPWTTLVIYEVLLGIALRFIHHALFGGTMFSLYYYLVDTVILLIIGALGYRFTQAKQMTTQYSWLYERTGPWSWRPRTGAVPAKQ